MDVQGLCAALRAAGVPAGLYEIAGCPAPPGTPRPEDRLYLAREEGGWVVGVRQRGVRTVLERFPDEERACGSLYARLTDPGPPSVPLTAEEKARLPGP
ncbi:hypothetical protein [Streptomyces griseoruber]|uniref:Uncharacterized protein n=1 Tax=Streptomyces griseoruber TaxID=1943 RepID=A0A101SUB8_9ACTN|nr:hypothetical protein [Streptomyces griseoruber]KUN80089.1 hypothetical protein AQJ64_27150 [Streptomyces griseoruber]